MALKLDLKRYLENLEHDIGNGGTEEDTVAMIHYIAGINMAHKMLIGAALGDLDVSTDDEKLAFQYLSLCQQAGGSLYYLASATEPDSCH